MEIVRGAASARTSCIFSDDHGQISARRARHHGAGASPAAAGQLAHPGADARATPSSCVMRRIAPPCVALLFIGSRTLAGDSVFGGMNYASGATT